MLPATPGSSLHVAQHRTEEIQTSPPVVPHVACGLKTLNLFVKATTKLFFPSIFFVTFLYNYKFVLINLYFLKVGFVYKYLLHGCYSLPFELSGGSPSNDVNFIVYLIYVLHTSFKYLLYLYGGN